MKTPNCLSRKERQFFLDLNAPLLYNNTKRIGVTKMTKHYFKYGENELNHLRKKDKKLAAAINKIGIIKRQTNPDLFSALVESIIAQQISSKAAETVSGRLYDLCNSDYRNLYNLTIEEIQSCGMSMRKASYIKNIADLVVFF